MKSPAYFNNMPQKGKNRRNNNKSKGGSSNPNFAQLAKILEAKLSAKMNHNANLFKQRRNKKPATKKVTNPNRQNQTRTITDVPLGNSQRNGFNRNSASKTVTKDEYIADIAGTVAFTTTQYAVQPGQGATFPWLAIEAKQWEKYEFEKLEFYLKPEVTQYTTNANSGKVILSFDADASDPPPLNKQEAEDVMPMADGMSYQTVNLNIPKFILQSHHDSFYVRPGNLPGGSDIKTYDLGNLFVSTIGQGAPVANMMELRVRYTCRLMIPILENTAAAPQNNQVTLLVDSIAALTIATPYQPLLATAASTALQVTNGLNAVNTAGSLVLPAGNYMIDVDVQYDNTGVNFSLAYLNVLFNGVVQNPGTRGFTCELNSTGGTYQTLHHHISLFYASSGLATSAITTSIYAVFGAGTATATTTFRAVAV
jgi:hypothetical protein